MKRKIATMFLDELIVLENGRPGASDAENIIVAGLIWPRPMIDLRTAARSSRLEDGVVVKFSEKPFHEKILFKEIVGGKFGVTVEVTERKSPGVIAQFLSSIASDVVDAVFPLPPSGETFRRIIHAGVSGLGARARSSPKETILRIAFGHAVVDPSTPGNFRLDIPLSAPQTIASPSSSATKSRRAPILTEGQPNGRAVLSCVIEDD